MKLHGQDFSSIYLDPYIKGYRRFTRLPLYIHIGIFAAILAMIAGISGFIYLNQARAFSGGTGTWDDPYVITTCAQLQSFPVNPDLYTKDFVLGNNIDCTGVDFVPIGMDRNFPSNRSYEFSGRFDGAGHTISNVTIAQPADETRAGLFIQLADAYVHNLTLDHIALPAQGSPNRVGLLAGDAEESAITGITVTNATFNGSPVTYTQQPAPYTEDDTLVGHFDSTGEFDYFYNPAGYTEASSYTPVGSCSELAADLQANPHGWYSLSNDIDCAGNTNWIPFATTTATTFNGRIDGNGHTLSGVSIDFTGENLSTSNFHSGHTWQYYGGLFDATAGPVIQNVTLAGSGMTDSDVFAVCIGGLAGSAPGMVLKNIHSTVPVDIDNDGIGGLVACGGGTVLDTSVQTDITTHEDGEGDGGGLLGNGFWADIENSTFEGSVSGGYSMGGVLGNYEHAHLDNVHATTTLSGVIFFGGISGPIWGDGHSILNNVSADTIIVDSPLNEDEPYTDFGGISAELDAADVSNVTASTTVTLLNGSGGADFGGLAGTMTGTIGDSFPYSTTTNVHANLMMTVNDGGDDWDTGGGLIGESDEEVVTDSSASSTMIFNTATDIDSIGGFIGFSHVAQRAFYSNDMATSTIVVNGDTSSTFVDEIGGFGGGGINHVSTPGATDGDMLNDRAISNISIVGNEVDDTGGFLGFGTFQTTGLLSQISASTTMSITSPLVELSGCLIGDTATNIDQAYVSGTLSISSGQDDSSTASAVGGLVGDYFGGTLSNSYSTCGINITSGVTSGLGANYIGSLVGEFDSDTISNSYAVGPITLDDGGVGAYYSDVGGLIGTADASSLTLANAFSAATVTAPVGSINVGSFIGSYTDATDFTGNAYDGSANPSLVCSGQDGSDPAWCTTKTPASYFYTATNQPLVSWDFSSIWQANTCTYPSLRYLSFLFGDICGAGPTPTPPTLSTDAASSLSQTGATLNGSIDDIGTSAPTVRGFAYGTDTSYGATTTDSGSFSAGSFSDSLSSLTCAVTYHFRSYATSPDGTGYGSDQSFTTSACSSGGGSPPSSSGSSGQGSSAAPAVVPPSVISPVVPPVTPLEPPATSTSGTSGQSALPPAETPPAPPAAVTSVTPPPTSIPYVTVPSINPPLFTLPSLAAVSDLALKVFDPSTPSHAAAVTTGLALGLIGIIWTFLSGAYALTDIPLLLLRGPSLFGFLRRRKKHETWGTVYDSQTKRGLDPAIVTLYDASGNEVKQAVTDLDGRFGFDVAAGTYALTAGKTNHIFPARNLAPVDPIYTNRYEGGPIPMPSPGVLIKDVPLDPTKFDWNEAQKYHNGFLRFYSRFDRPLAYLSILGTILGAILALISVFIDPSTLNLVLIILYALMGILYAFDFAPRLYGSIRTKDGDFLANALIRVKSAATGSEVGHTVTDHLGRYYLLVPPTDHATMTIERLTGPDQYVKVWEGTLKTKKGYLNGKIRVN